MQTAEALERWKAHEPNQYVVQTCTIGIKPPGCVRAAIDGGEVVSIAEHIYAHDDFGWEDFTEEHAGGESPVDAMFTRVAEGDDEECALEQVEYDAERGYVESYVLRCDGAVNGGRSVACFEADTIDIELCDVTPRG